MTYSSGAAAALGSLLRKAQEDRQAGPHLIPQSAEESSPIRQQIQGPIVAPESVGSEKTVAMKGEMQPIQEGVTAAPTVAGATVVPPSVAPVVAPASNAITPSPVPLAPGPSPMSAAAIPSSIGTALLPSSMKSSRISSPVSQLNTVGLPSAPQKNEFIPSINRSSLIPRASADESALPIPSKEEIGKKTIETKQSPITPAQKIVGAAGAAVDVVGRLFGDPFKERGWSEKLQKWGGSRTVAATKPGLKSIFGKK